MRRNSDSVPGIRRYPDLRRSLLYELSRNTDCSSCNKNDIFLKYLKLVQERDAQQQNIRP